jgi:hypothetical protein
LIALRRNSFRRAFFAPAEFGICGFFYVIKIHHAVLCITVEHYLGIQQTVSPLENSHLCGSVEHRRSSSIRKLRSGEDYHHAGAEIPSPESHPRLKRTRTDTILKKFILKIKFKLKKKNVKRECVKLSSI